MNIISKFNSIAQPTTYLVRANLRGGLGATFKLVEDITYRRTPLASLLKPEGFIHYHGTSKEALGNQLEKGQFENRNGKIYFADKGTAVRYAKRREERGETPVVLIISSSQSSKSNPMAVDGWGSGELGAYSYFETNTAPVKIEKVFASSLESIDPTLAELMAQQAKKEGVLPRGDLPLASN